MSNKAWILAKWNSSPSTIPKRRVLFGFKTIRAFCFGYSFCRNAAEVAEDIETLSFSTGEVLEVEDTKPEIFPSIPGIGNTVWLFGMLSFAYLHCCSTGYSIPALLPTIASDTGLTDQQAALLTVGFTLVFAIFQIPFGFLADKMERPKLLSSGIVIWSVITSLASKATSFSDLMLVRLSMAAAQSMQNPISLGMIPELFPNRSTTAMALYNCALYFGRAISFIFALILAKFGAEGMLGIQTVPLDQFDVETMSLLYMIGDKATVAPLFNYEIPLLPSDASSWRDLLFWVGVPGMGIAFLLSLFKDPRNKTHPTLVAPSGISLSQLWPTIQILLQTPSYRSVTIAASINDIGFWSLISWQAIFYERVFNIPSNVYAPFLAAIIPFGGIVGGVGGGLIADWLTKRKARYLLTVGATCLGAPLIFMSFEAPTYQLSFMYLIFGFCFSECFRASAAIMVRQSSPGNAVSTATAVHLFTRNLVASIGPILVATLEPKIGLQNAMSIIPASFLISAVYFGISEKQLLERQALLEAESVSQE